MGAETKLKAGLAGEEKGKPPLRVPGRQGQQAAKKASPPPGTWTAETVSAASGLTPGCRGLRPRRNKVKISPFPLGRGAGGWGQKIYDMAGKTSEAGHSPPPGAGLAGATGGKEGKPPCGCRDGKVSRRPTGQTPAGDMGGRVSRQPSPPCAPAGTANARRANAARVQVAGMQGAKPLA